MRVFGCIILLLALAPLAVSQSISIHGELLSDWTTMKDTMLKIGDAMPEDKFGFKPTSAQRSFGEQLLHVANDNIALLKLVGSRVPAPGTDKTPISKAEILKALAESYDYGIAVMKEQNDRSMVEVVRARGYTGTRARLVWSATGHAWDEYGVMTVYLRLNGIVPPASRPKSSP
jgi:hypothetical protein